MDFVPVTTRAETWVCMEVLKALPALPSSDHCACSWPRAPETGRWGLCSSFADALRCSSPPVGWFRRKVFPGLLAPARSAFSSLFSHSSLCPPPSPPGPHNYSPFNEEFDIWPLSSPPQVLTSFWVSLASVIHVQTHPHCFQPYILHHCSHTSVSCPPSTSIPCLLLSKFIPPP